MQFFNELLLLLFITNIRCEVNKNGELNQKINSVTEAHSIQAIIPKGYDPTKAPIIKAGVPVTVKITLSILTIRSVDEDKSSFTVDVFFYQEWLEPRIVFPYKDRTKIVLGSPWGSKLWIPKPYFKNSYSGSAHNIISPETYMLLYDNNVLFYASRIACTFSCAMRLETYPHDVQECPILIALLQHTTDTVVLMWNNFKISSKIMLAQFDVKLVPTGNCTRFYRNLGTYSCICGGIRLARRLGYYLMNRYIPSCLIVIMSFVTFWLPAEAYPARIALPVTSLLSLVTQLHQSAMPNVSYIMAISIWMSSCIAFTFSTLLEYALVIAVMDKRKAKEEALIELRRIAFESTGKKYDEEAASAHPIETHFYVSHVDIDRFCRVLYPAIYFLYVFLYWMNYGV